MNLEFEVEFSMVAGCNCITEMLKGVGLPSNCLHHKPMKILI